MRYYIRFDQKRNPFSFFLVPLYVLFASLYISPKFLIPSTIFVFLIVNEVLYTKTIEFMILQNNKPYAYKKIHYFSQLYTTLVDKKEDEDKEEWSNEVNLISAGFKYLPYVTEDITTIIPDNRGVWIWVNNVWVWKGKTRPPPYPDVDHLLDYEDINSEDDSDPEIDSSDSESDSESESNSDSTVSDPINNMGRSVGNFNKHFYYACRDIVLKIVNINYLIIYIMIVIISYNVY